MDHVYQAIASLIQNAENVGLMLLALFLFAGNVFQAWLHIIWRKEERKDRLDMVDTLRTVQTSRPVMTQHAFATLFAARGPGGPCEAPPMDNAPDSKSVRN